MANVVVTFTRVKSVGEEGVALEVAELAYSESITAPNVGSLSARKGDQVVIIWASDDCWVAIGTSPVATSGSARRFIGAGQEKQFAVELGSKVAVST